MIGSTSLENLNTSVTCQAFCHGAETIAGEHDTGCRVPSELSLPVLGDVMRGGGQGPEQEGVLEAIESSMDFFL